MAAPADLDAAFEPLRALLADFAPPLVVAESSRALLNVNTAAASPFPQHRGAAMWFGAVRRGKNYVSFHLMPLYMSPALQRAIPPELQKRMQGKTCFQFRQPPDAKTEAQLRKLTRAALEDWQARGWA